LYLIPVNIFYHFPRSRGLLYPLKKIVLLRPYYPIPTFKQKRDRSLWLLIKSPKLRRDPQVLTITIESMIPEHINYSWFECPYMWDSRYIHLGIALDTLYERCLLFTYYNNLSAEFFISDITEKLDLLSQNEKERLGVDKLDYERLGRNNFNDNIAYFTDLCQRYEVDKESGITQEENYRHRVSLSILKLDKGDFENAFKLFKVELDPKIKENHHYSFIVYNLTLAAPWKFHPLLSLKENKSTIARNNKSYPAREYIKKRRLFQLPNQKGMHRESIYFYSEKGVGKLDILSTTSYIKESEVLWKRNEEIDLKRFKIIPKDCILSPRVRIKTD